MRANVDAVSGEWSPGTTKRQFEHPAEAFAVVFVVKTSQLVLLDAYDDWTAALEAAGLRE